MLRNFLILILLSIAAMPAQAILNIDIVGGREGALPIAVAPFGGTAVAENIAAIISNDLRLSGRFAPLATLPEQPTEAGQINFPLWRGVNTHHLVIGRIQPAASGNGYNIEFQLFDVLKGGQTIGFSFPATNPTLRRTAHRISDMIYEALTGEKGAFNSRIAYVTVNRGVGGKTYRLQVADMDGAGGQTILTSPEPLLSPTWSPNGENLAYVSFEDHRTAVYVQDVRSGDRKQVAAWPGLNTAPAFSPDGNRLALSLSRDGNPEIYVLNLTSRSLDRLTVNPAIDTEPAWSPDGNFILFTSDRGGSPQIYQMPAASGPAQRLTFAGNYNASGSYSPDGKKLAFLNGDGGAYRIAVMDLLTRQTLVLTSTTLDESPSFAPNGSMIIYATGADLAAVSVDGRVRQRLAVDAGEEVREPAWSPLNQ